MKYPQLTEKISNQKNILDNFLKVRIIEDLRYLQTI